MIREKRLALALDTPDLTRLVATASRFGPRVGALKLGLEAFAAFGPKIVDLIAPHAPIFLDLKLHDIPNTVAGAIRALRGRGIRWLTVHASGGPAMLEAARAAAGEEIALLGVTILTSLSEADATEIGLRGPIAASVDRLAGVARGAGLAGVVCSPLELKLLRPQCPPPFWLVTPGIRPAASGAGDQARTASPAAALRDGADLLVVGRPVLAAPDPDQALGELLEEIGQV